MNRRQPTRRSMSGHILAVAALAVVAALLTACPRRTPTAPEGLVRTYIVRGRVASLPVPDKPLTEFMVHHEAIPDFERQDGTLGMNEMTMAFPLGDGVRLDGIAIGDIVELELHVRWKPKPRFWTSRVTELPPETVLNLRAQDPR